MFSTAFSKIKIFLCKSSMASRQIFVFSFSSEYVFCLWNVPNIKAKILCIRNIAFCLNFNASFGVLANASHAILDRFRKGLQIGRFLIFFKSRFFKPFSGAHQSGTFVRSFPICHYRRSILDVILPGLLWQVEQCQMKGMKYNCSRS